MKVLDYTGLQNLWTNIKNYITAHTPTSTSELTNDSGFLTSTDISSKANDSEVVHKAQNETVTGEKTFKKDVKIIDLNANERPGVQFEVNGSFITFEQAKDALPDTDFGDFGVGTVWSAFWLNDNTKIQNSMSDYVINDITFGTTGVGSVIEFNNYYKVKYEEADNIQTDLRGMLRFELVPYAGVQKDSMMWTNPKLYFYAKLDNDEFGDTILGHEDARWSKAYIDEINCYEIKFGGNSIRDILEHIISLSYVTHYSSTALTSNSTNSLSIIDNQDSIKVGDKVIDSSGVIYSVTAIDTANSTFTIGASLIDLAQDSDVMHKSGNETVGGEKTFNDLQIIGYGTQYKGNRNAYILPEFSAGYSGLAITTLGYSQTLKIGNFVLDTNNRPSLDPSKGYIQVATGENNGVNTCVLESRNTTSSSLGTSSNKWGGIYATNYYYGANSVEFSDKFVTTDTAQTISGAKTFSDNISTKKITSDGVTTGDEYSTNAKTNLWLMANRDTEGVSGVLFDTFRQNTTQGTGSHILGISIKENSVRYEGCRFSWGWDNNLNGYYLDFKPTTQGTHQAVKHNLGTSTDKWDTLNGLEPSSLSLPNFSNRIDISSYVTNLNGTYNAYTPSVNGWIAIQSSDATFIRIADTGSGGTGNTTTSQNAGILTCMMPVIANRQCNVYIKCTTLTSAYFIPCQGNV